MKKLGDIKIETKLLAGFLAVGLIPFAVIGIISVTNEK